MAADKKPRETNSMAAKSNSEKRPRGWKKFADLTRKLCEVPKEEADAQIEASRKERKRKRREK